MIGIEAPHFVDFVLTQVKESRSDLSGAGLSLYTTLDPDMQAAAQAAVQTGLEELEKKFKKLRTKEGEEPLQAALIALDPHTGSIRALVGGRDYQVSQFNRVVQARRQPGSLFKPFVYLAAFERRDLVPPVTPITILQDSPIALVFGKTEEETWSPRNYDGQFRGPVTVRYALEHSLNIPTVRLAVWETGGGKTLLTDVIAAARRAGITSPMKAYPSLALGAFECTPMEIAAAYSVFANGGILVKPNSLLGLVGPEGRRIDRKDVPLQRAADPAAVSVLDSILQGVVNRGTGASARGRGAQGIFAGKTGTTNDGRDAWFIGFSPRLLVAVWVGFDDNRGLNLSGSTAAVPIYADFARRLPSHFFEEPFPEVPGVVTASVDPTTGMLVTEDCPTSVNEQFLAGTEPTERCTVHGDGSPRAGEGTGPSSGRRDRRAAVTGARFTVPDVDLDLVARSHGWYDLPPFAWDEGKRRLSFVFLHGGSPVPVLLASRGWRSRRLFARACACREARRRPASSTFRPTSRRSTLSARRVATRGSAGWPTGLPGGSSAPRRSSRTPSRSSARRTARGP